MIYPTAPQNKVEEAKKGAKATHRQIRYFPDFCRNGTASRESEQVIVELIKELKKPVQYVIVNEAGASVYSASKLATEEFPNFDVGQRSAASIARRLQDPLAELVKIDPKSIGVGQYQHDMNQKKLGEALGGVVEDCVNRVGVDLNTASAPLLEYISGVSKAVAKNIVDYREENGRFTNRRQLLKVPKLGPKAFEQCAGFLRISDGDNPLDATSVHPESYPATMELLEKLELSMEDVRALQAESKKAAHGSASGSGKAGDTGALENQKKAGRNDRRKGGFQIRSTNTAMGQALAAALKDMDMGERERTAAAAKQKNGAAAGQRFSETAQTACWSAIKDKDKLAQELGIGEITTDGYFKGAGKAREGSERGYAQTDPSQRCFGDEGLKAGHDLKRDGAQCDRFRRICRHRRSSGRARPHFPDHKPLHQASAGSGQCRGRRGCEGAGRGCAQKTHQLNDASGSGEKIKNRGECIGPGEVTDESCCRRF